LVDSVNIEINPMIIGFSECQGARFSTLTAIALTNLFGAIRGHKEAERGTIAVSVLQKHWEQGNEDLARIMRTNVSFGGNLLSADNEMSKGAVSIC